MDGVNFFITCTQTMNETIDMSDDGFDRTIDVAIRTLSNLLKSEEVSLFRQLCKTATKLIMVNYRMIPFEISANKNLDKNYENKVDAAIQQCELVEECHSLLRKILPKRMNQLAVLLNNLLIPLEI
ncbi:hypothetical protein FACS1894218_3190 [Bacilli bacterium]|nr:hypothetical protein FACS1894218_3190 [Bacilli bacterium]